MHNSLHIIRFCSLVAIIDIMFVSVHEFSRSDYTLTIIANYVFNKPAPLFLNIDIYRRSLVGISENTQHV